MNSVQQESVEPDCQPTLVITPTRGWRLLDLRELFGYRELVYFLVWRDVKVRYKQTAIGVFWALLQPLALMLVFTLFFGRLAHIEQRMEIPYPLFAYVGLLPWQLFARSLSESTASLVSDQKLVTKVYFPRIILPTTKCLAALVDFGISAVLLVGLMAYHGISLRATVVWLPVFVALMLVTSLGVAYWLSALNAEYRDVAYAVPFLVQFWFFVTPVVYPTAMVPARLRWLMGLNPMTGVVDGMRWCLFGDGEGPGWTMALSAAVSCVLLVGGVVWFRWRERTFVDALGST